jgi:hypothetical protein
MSTHTGKIGRLPQGIREQVNQRLDDGEPATKILGWLNGLTAVRGVLAAQFGGRAINEPNLSHWRRGGHQEWLKEQERRAAILELTQNWSGRGRPNPT